jgi:hypothetical protein
MSILSVDNISPIGSGTSVTVNSAATLVLTNANSTGVVTATSFVGSGANLTNLPAQATIANNADNRVITGGSGVNLNGEANLIFDGTNLGIGGNPDVDFHIKSAAPTIRLTDTDTNRFSQIYAVDGNLRFDADNSNAQADTNIAFRTDGSERLRINSSGQLLLGSSSSANAGYKLESYSSGAYNIMAKSTNGNGGYHNFTGQASNGTITSYITHNGRGYFEDGVQFDSSGEVLDSYEEGTYTPVITYDSADSGNKTYQSRHGTYTKIGRVVTANFYVELSNRGTGNGAVAVSLPFTVGSYLNSTSLEAGGVIHYFTNLMNSWSDITLSALDGLARCRMYGISGQYAGNAVGFEYSAISNTFNIRGSITYQST